MYLEPTDVLSTEGDSSRVEALRAKLRKAEEAARVSKEDLEGTVRQRARTENPP